MYQQENINRICIVLNLENIFHVIKKSLVAYATT